MDVGLDVYIVSEIVCVLLIIFCNTAKTALTALGDLGVSQIASSYKSSTKVLELWLNHSGRLINTTIFIKITCYTIASIFGVHILKNLFASMPTALGIAITVAVFVVVCEIIPKAFAKKNASAAVLPNIYILRIFYYILYPVTSLMEGISSLVSGNTNDSGSSKRAITEDELEYLIDASEEQGVMEEQKREMLANIFDISDIQVKSVMVPRTDMVAVPVDITKDEFIKVIQENEYSRIPVYDDTLDRIIGILYTKDIFKLMNKEWNVKELMDTMHDAIFVPETKKIDDMLKEFQRARQQLAVVVDEYGGVAGIVTMENVLEEIVGDIWDEHDDEAEEQDIVKLSDTTFRIDARTNIDDLCDYLSIERTEDTPDYDTVGGLIYDIAGAIPNIGDVFIWGDFTITIESMEDNKIGKVVLKKSDNPT